MSWTWQSPLTATSTAELSKMKNGDEKNDFYLFIFFKCFISSSFFTSSIYIFFIIWLSYLCTFFALLLIEMKEEKSGIKGNPAGKITTPSFSTSAPCFAQINKSEWMQTERKLLITRNIERKTRLQSLSFLMILRMYKRKRAGVRDLSHLAASRSQWLRVGSPVMFNRSPGEEEEKKERKRRKVFSSPVSAEIQEERRLCEEASAKQNGSGGHQRLVHRRG